MTWQDIVLTVANIVFSISLLPQVFFGFKEKTGSIRLQTSIPTFLGLYAISFVYWTLALYFAATVSLITGTMWFLLFLQRVLYEHP